MPKQASTKFPSSTWGSTSAYTSSTTSSSSYASSSTEKKGPINRKEAKDLLKDDGCCCGEPVIAVYKPGFNCCEQVKGPFQKALLTPYDRYIKKYCHPQQPPVPPSDTATRLTRPPCRPYLTTTAYQSGCCKGTCDGSREHKVCQAELQRMRDERWKAQEKKAMLDEKRRRQWLDEQYMSQARQWEDAQRKCVEDQKRRKKLAREMHSQRKEMKRLREEEKKWREYKKRLFLKHKQKEEDMWVNEYSLREEQKRLAQERLQAQQEDKWLNVQMAPRDTEGMAVPELEELRRMFAPVVRGPKETFEYFLVEPRPTTAEMKKSATLKMAALMGLRDQHGIHLDLSDRCQKRTTIQLAMGPKLTNGERNQCCNVVSTPGASCCKPSSMPNVPLPKCLRPLMQTLSYRVNEMNSPLLSMQNTSQPGGQPGPGPNFNGSRLYGTVVIPKGQLLSPYYTDPHAVTF